MWRHDIVLLTLRQWDGEVQGKTRLQKLIYFAGVMTGQEDELGYTAHFYGPYSATIDGALYDLTATGLIEQRTLRTGQMNDEGFEKVRYDYELTDVGRRVAERRASELGGKASPVTQALQELQTLGERHYMRLAAAAKSYYLLKQAGKPVTRDEVRRMAEGFGWSLSPEAVEDAIDYLERLELVKAEH